MSRATAQEYDAELVDAPPQMPEGEYQAVYVRHETSYLFKTPKVYIHYRIHGGPHDGDMVYGAYPVKALKGKPRGNGAFKLGHSHKLYREMVALTGVQERPDRVSLKALKGALLRVRIRTVKADARQKPLPSACQYSVVDEMLGVDAGTVR